MKPALQALLISPDPVSRRKILEGTQTKTVREGYRDYKNGAVMLCCHLEPWAITAEITYVCHRKLSDVTPHEYTAAGFTSLEGLHQDLRRYYKEISLDSPVTIITWKDVRGKIVDDYRAEIEHKQAE